MLHVWLGLVLAVVVVCLQVWLLGFDLPGADE